VLHALEDNEQDRNCFFGVLAGSVRPDEFASLPNIVRILNRAGLLSKLDPASDRENLASVDADHVAGQP
jgi:hypothetical protein